MSKDIRNDQAKAPAEHKEREGATDYSGWQPSSKHSSQGSTDAETSVSKDQRIPQSRQNEVSVGDQSAHTEQARRDSTKD
jgi:hypothetical protein